MNILRKIFAGFYIISLLSLSVFAASPEAAGAPTYQAGDSGGTVLPSTRFEKIVDCERIMFYVNIDVDAMRKAVSTREGVILEGLPSMGEYGALVTANDILGCAIKTGDIKLWMVPFYIRYVLEFVIGVAGLLVVGGIVYGGYLYLFGALTEQKEQGKKAIINSLIGLVLSLSAWAIVSIVIQFVSR